MEYVIITPAKNEGRFIERTIQSVLYQKKKPIQWIIINDNSSDNTKNIINNYKKKYNWIRLINLFSVEIHEISQRISYLINFGVSQIKTEKYDLIMKLDADVTFGPNFCKDLISEFADDRKLGIASGNLSFKGIKEKNIDEKLTRGAAKFYRKECWNQIGGTYLSRGWDTIDNYAAQFYGWHTKKFDYYFEHLKEEGSKSGTYKVHYWTGKFNGRVPYNFWYFILKIFYHLFDKPVMLGTIIQFYGYIESRFIVIERPFPKEISAFVRKEQTKKLKSIFRLVN